MHEPLTSLQNPKVKELIRWQAKSRQRIKDQVIIVEGIKENQLALQSGLHAQKFFVQEGLFHHQIQLPQKSIIYTVSSTVFERIAYRGTTGGIIGIYSAPNRQLEDFSWTAPSLFMVLESVEKPGNLGAVLRSADAAAATAVIICDPKTDIFNPNVVRSSLGTVFTTPVFTCTTQEWLEYAEKHAINNFATHLNADSVSLYSQNYTQNTAFILGTESTGLTDQWINQGHTIIKIPMQGSIDSLNVSNAAAICLFEAVRQREVGH
ncbi:MAG: TrmH family RNA methyltransferase [Weeksellaceae bacterium]|nr:TrmH family RNA methyltransferase [Weeksellaceae bacterium]